MTINHNPGTLVPMTEKCRECGQPLDASSDVTASANAHLFFEALAKSTRAPHYAQTQRDWVNQILNRAIEAGLYLPPGEA